MKRLLFPLLMLCGCDAVVHGHVISKEVEPETVIYIPQIEHCGKDCSMPVMIPYFYPESYRVTVEGPNGNGKITRNDLYLEKEDFDRTRIGDIYECGEVKQCVTGRPGGKEHRVEP